MTVKIDINSGCLKITQSNTIKYQLNLTEVLRMVGKMKKSVYFFIIKYKIIII